MRILYLSCHEVLEFDELSLLTEIDDILPENHKLDIQVFSMGAFANQTQSGGYLRNVIPKGKFGEWHQKLYAIAMQCDKDNIHPEIIANVDVIISMHNSAVPGQRSLQPWITNNFRKFKEANKKVIFRSIGQSTPSIEKELEPYRDKGMNIVRYSPLEEKIPEFAGQDALIRFAKDPEEFKGWTGERKQVITVAQSFKKRGDHLGYSLFEKITYNFQRKVYGTENEDLGEVNGGRPSYEELKDILQQSRVGFYFGTKPAPYTLSLIEMMLTGTPIVAVGPKLRGDNEAPYKWHNYEIPEIISTGVNGYWSDNIDELRGYIELLLNDDETAKRISEAGRKTAIELWDKRRIMSQWAEFLAKI